MRQRITPQPATYPEGSGNVSEYELNWAWQQIIGEKPDGDDEEPNRRAARYVQEATGLEPEEGAELLRKFFHTRREYRRALALENDPEVVEAHLMENDLYL